jgi:hypothetical protein
VIGFTTNFKSSLIEKKEISKYYFLRTLFSQFVLAFEAMDKLTLIFILWHYASSCASA